ncbi:MAG: ABC transporter ATP-binding protein [Clostridiales bacterium]|nr:ABC transporter ATP-binding protein [Clostridiales bacterium]
MIELNNVNISYWKKQILHDITFTASDAEITIILGKNGCGKSTLMRAVTGSLKYVGSISIDGCEVSKTSSQKRAQMLSLMPQLLARPSITLRELVSFGRQPYAGVSGILTKRDWELVDNAIKRTGISQLTEAYANQVSGGELQKAYLAMTLAQDTQNLLLDEPLAHLDIEYERRIAEFLLNMKQNGRCVLTVFHNINRALELADRIIVVGDGCIQFNGSADEFITADVAGKYFGLNSYDCTDENGNKRRFYA